MGIHLDWDVEAQDGEHHVGEDPNVLAERQRRKRRLRRIAIGGGVMLAILGVAALVRAVQVANVRRDMLEATIESEALSLRIGDRAAFMARQGENDLWRTAQAASFGAYQQLSPRIELPGDILGLKVDGDNASAELAAIIDSQEHRFTWKYQYADRGWRHVASEDVPWEPRTLVGNYGITYSYYALDEPLAQSLNTMLAGWWRTVSPVVGGGSAELDVALLPEPSLQVGWSEGGTLIVPSVDLDGGSLDRPDETLRSTLVDTLAMHWGNQALFSRSSSVDGWVAGELHAAMRHLIDPNTDSSDVLGPFIDLYGIEFLKHFLVQLEGGRTASIALREAVWQSYNTHAGQVDFGAHMRAFLQSEVGCRSAEAYVCPANGIYTAEYQYGGEISSSLYLGDLEFADPASVRVTSARQVGDLIWLEAQLRYSPGWGDVSTGLPSEPAVRYFSFRQYDGAWLHSYPQYADQGVQTMVSGPYVTLIYFEQDAPFAEGLHPYLEQAYAKVAADFALENRAPIIATIGAPVSAHSGPNVSGNQIFIPSAYVSCCFAGFSPQVQVQHDAAERLVEHVVAQRSNMPEWYGSLGPVAAALSEWEMARLGFLPAPPNEFYSFWAGHFPGSLVESWSTVPEGSHESPEAYYVRLLEARTFFATIEQQYGPQGIAALVENLSLAQDVNAWLYASLGIQAADIEPAWEARYAAERDALLRSAP